MTHEEMLQALNAAADPEYAGYQNKIVCDTRYPMLHVRMPALRKIAKVISDTDWQSTAEDCGFSCFEEVLTVCLAVAGANAMLDERLEVLEPLISHLDSWALTDSIVPTLAVKESERLAAWEFSVRCIRSEGEYVRRFGVVMMLVFLLVPEYLDRVEDTVVSICDQRYYVRMACAWLLAEMAVLDWYRVERILKSGKLDIFVHNMTIRKIRESLRISGDRKAAAAAWKRKEEKNV